MKKSWLPAVALSLGWMASTTAFGQYPNAYNNFGPSSYPIQQQQQQAQPSGTFQNLPQVPQQQYQQQYQAQSQPLNQQLSQSAYQPAYQQPTPQASQQASPYQLVATQNRSGAGYGAGTQGILESVPAPAPTMSQPTQQNLGAQQPALPAPLATAQPMQHYSAPVDNGYGQMVAPQANVYAPNYFGGNAYAGNSQVFGRPLQASSADRHVAAGLPCGAKPWYFGAGALIYQRIDDHDMPLSFGGADYDTNLITTHDARMGTTGGFEATVGRYFNCGKNAVEATYWGLYPSDESILRTGMPGDLRTRIPFQHVEMSGTPMMPSTPIGVADWFNNARAHELRRSSNYHNVEVNLLGYAVGGAARNFNMSTAGSLFSGSRHADDCGYCGGAGCGTCAAPTKYATGPCGLIAPTCGSRLNLSWLAGFRYFHFSDGLQYAASRDDTMVNRAADDLYYNVDTTNDLFGFQLGSRMDYCLGSRFNLYSTGKVGVYNNHSRMQSRLGTDMLVAYVNDTRSPTNPNNYGSYNFDEMQDTIAFMGEIGSGVGVRLSPKWTGTVGYRAMYVSGVATAPGNVRETFANFNDIANYNTSNSLILHGMNVGAQYNF